MIRTKNTSFSERSSKFLDNEEQRILALSDAALPDEIRSIARENERWRVSECLNMICSENVMSKAARQLLGTDFVLRTAEGFPGDRVHPPRQQARYLDKIEALVYTLSRRLFKAEYVEWRPTSSTMANTIVFHACLRRGDLILSQSEDGGGNYCYHEVAGPGLVGLRVQDIPFYGREFEIDLERTRTLARQLRPKMIVIGGSNVLFPYPLKELRAIADEIGSKILYDAAHVAVLAAAGLFQNPLAEGADVVTFSTHKSFGGPVGGLIFMNDESIALPISTCVHPTFLQSRDKSAYCALAMTMAEHVTYGRDYAGRMIANAKALGEAFAYAGFEVIGAARGYTETHQVYLSMGSVEAARSAQNKCQAANILIAANFLAGDMTRGGRTGLRMTTQELTRRGLGKEAMRRIARLIKRLVVDGEPVARIRKEVGVLAAETGGSVSYTFDTQLGL